MAAGPQAFNQNLHGADILKYPLDLDGATNEYSHRINFTVYKQSPMHGNIDVIASIHLYMPPDALKTSYQQSYADADVGAGQVCACARSRNMVHVV